MSKKSPYKFLPPEIKVIFEDADLIIVDKKAGILSVPTEHSNADSVLDMLNNFVRKGNYRSKKEVFATNRLDRGTSGIVIFAKTKEFREKMHENWQDFSKTYLAVVEGVIPEKSGLIESYLLENESSLKVKSTKNTKKGKLARTSFKVINRGKNWTALEIDLLTGRKNQIRVHFSEKNFPLLNDQKYGAKAIKSSEQLALHAFRFGFIHPNTKEEILLESKPPKFFDKFFTELN